MRTGKGLSVVLLLSLCSTLLLTGTRARAAEDVTEHEYEENARVMRVTLTKGEVSLRRAGNVEWETARVNLPLVEGDTLATARDSHLEIQLDARNFVRLGQDSVLKIITLRDEGVALSLSEGTATLRLARFDSEREYFEIDAPKTTLAAEKRGLYRLDVSPEGTVRVTVRDDGRARIYNETSGFVLRNNRTARLSYDTQGEADWELSSAAPFDGWDNWNDERERYLASRLRHEGRERYYDPEVWGAEELDVYGDWSYTREYGYVWRPHVTVINRYPDWAPYRYGQWRWCPPYGWTWIPDEDWGWAPYHYGRWVYVNGYWCWAPRGYGYPYKRAWWRPALVVFVQINTSFGNQVCWYPLTHGQRDPRGRWWSRHYDRLEPLRRNDLSHLRRSNPALLRAVSTVPSREFGVRNARARAASADIAQRALSEAPLRGRLPITPNDVPRVGAPTGEGRGRRAEATGSAGRRGTLSIERPAPVMPARSLPERTTGAAPRTPGAPLDAELRRARVFNGREPRQSTSAAGTNEGGAAEAGTGAVLRPSRPERRPSRPTEDRDSGSSGGEPGEVVIPRARRPDEGVRDNSDSPRIRRERPSEAPRSAPPVYERSAPPIYERSEPRVRPSAPESRPQPRSEEPPATRPERHAPREERPAPRYEPPPREEHHAPRNDPPPQREERPSPPPAPPSEERQAPPARDSEPARERPSRSEDPEPPARKRPDNRR